MSGVIHKVKEAVTGHHSSANTTHSNTHANTSTNTSTNHGPHDSKIANKLDPRIDSDRDNRAAHHTTTTTGPHGTTVHSSTHGPQQAPVGAAGGVNTSSNPPGSHSTNAGPHNSNVANKVDPRIDSDRDNRARHENLGGAHGPHSSNLANKADPRIDSDRGPDNRAAGIGATGAIGTPGAYASGANHSYGAGTGTTTSTVGPHGSNLANKADPRIDSDMDNRARHQGLASSSYNTPGGGSTTAGPHRSNVANKLDPRVDSDLDNRHNVGTQRHF
ncbi:hypothetical protein BBP40_003506 [Aspergillus hancockii]|nr:hypothetical protein BBP40_003506 [Aspergillus hancockii]